MPKKAKISSTYRLTDLTKKEIKTVANLENMSEAEVIEYAVHKLYMYNHRNNPVDYPDLDPHDPTYYIV